MREAKGRVTAGVSVHLQSYRSATGDGLHCVMEDAIPVLSGLVHLSHPPQTICETAETIKLRMRTLPIGYPWSSAVQRSCTPCKCRYTLVADIADLPADSNAMNIGRRAEKAVAHASV
jgi:hypothetical protein